MVVADDLLASNKGRVTELCFPAEEDAEGQFSGSSTSAWENPAPFRLFGQLTILLRSSERKRNVITL